jgi:hypothetical protein
MPDQATPVKARAARARLRLGSVSECLLSGSAALSPDDLVGSNGEFT